MLISLPRESRRNLRNHLVEQQSPTFLAPGTSFMEDNFSTGRGGEDSSGSNVSDGEQWGAPDKASLAHPPLTSCCAAQFLTGCGLVAVCGLGVGDPVVEDKIQPVLSNHCSFVQSPSPAQAYASYNYLFSSA